MAKDLELAIQLKLKDQNVAAKLKLSEESVKKFGQAFRGVNAEADRTAAAVEKLNARLGAMGHAGAGLLAIWQGLKGMRGFLDTVGAVQQLDARVGALTASTQEYSRAQAFLDNLAQQHHKSVLTLADGYARLLPLQQSGILSGQGARDILTGLSNAQSALGASSNQLGQVMFGLAQALSSPIVRAEELNQVVEPIPGLLQAMDRAAQLPAGGFRNMVNEGLATSDFFGTVFVKALDEFKGAAERMGSTVPAKFADVENAWLHLVKAVEAPVSAVASGVLSTLAEDADILAGALKRVANLPELRLILALKNKTLGFSDDKELEIFRRDQAELMGRVFPKKADTTGADAKIATEKQKGALAALDSVIAGYRDKREKMEAEIAALRDAFRKAGVAETDPRFAETVRRIQKKYAEKPPKVKASIQNDAAEIESARLDARRRAEELALQLTQDGLKRQEDELKRSLDAQAIGQEEYYRRVAALRQQDLDAQVAAERDKRRLAEEALSAAERLTDAGQREKALLRAKGDIAEIDQKLILLERDRADVAAQAGADIARAHQDEAQSLRDLLDSYDAQAAKIHKIQDDVKRAFDLGATDAQIRGMIDAWDQGTSEMSEFANQAARNMQDAFADFLFDPFEDGMDGMLKGFLDTIRRMVAEAAAAQILKGLFGALGGANFLGTGGFFADVAASVKHAGGVVGAGGGGRDLPALAFVGAPRLHSGGWLKPGEVPTVLMQGEEVLTANDPRHRNNVKAGGVNMEVHIHEAPGTRTKIRQSAGEDGPRLDVIIEQVEQRLSANLARGGGIAPALERQYGLSRTAGALR